MKKMGVGDLYEKLCVVMKKESRVTLVSSEDIWVRGDTEW